MGMAEQLLFGAAAGMAQTGLIPFASTYSVFATRRAYDFICLDIASRRERQHRRRPARPHHRLRSLAPGDRGRRDLPRHTRSDDRRPLRLGGHHAGGAAAREHDGPTYLRLLRGQVPTVLDEYDYTFELGKAKVLRPGNDVVFVSSGLMTMRALQAAAELANHDVDVAVAHTPTLKPFDAETVLREVDTDRLAVTLEKPRWLVGCSRRWPRGASADSAGRSPRSHCPTSSLRQVPCQPFTIDTACRPSASSHRCSSACSIRSTYKC